MDDNEGVEKKEAPRVKKEKRYILQFMQNRRYELRVGNDVLIFMPHECKVVESRVRFSPEVMSVLERTDFLNAQEEN